MRRVPNNVSAVMLVTGGSGFIGSAYLNYAVPKYPKILFVNFDALTYAANQDNITVADFPNYRFVKGDIRDNEQVIKIFAKMQISSVLHFAAESHVDISIEHPDIFVETNVIGTHNLLKSALSFKVDRFHFVSTDEVYGTLRDITENPFSEKSPVAPNNPYSASKAGGEALVRAYERTFGMNTVITRGSNTYGKGQDESKFIPVIMNRLLRGKKIPLYSQGEHIRDWLYITDHVRGIDRVFHKGRRGEVYNIGGTCELTNRALVDKILVLFKKDSSWIEFTKDRPGHDFRYSLDTQKIRQELGWMPRVSLDRGLRETAFHWKKMLSPRAIVSRMRNSTYRESVPS